MGVVMRICIYCMPIHVLMHMPTHTYIDLSICMVVQVQPATMNRRSQCRHAWWVDGGAVCSHAHARLGARAANVRASERVCARARECARERESVRALHRE